MLTCNCVLACLLPCSAALSGQKLAELDELDAIPSQPTLMDKIKLALFHALQRYGFWAIVVCASVPNPLFDLAGLTCGHFLIPFWTFFGATFIGKAVFKVHIQSIFVILAFSRDRLEGIISGAERVVPMLTGKLRPFFEKQKAQFHKPADERGAEEVRQRAGRGGAREGMQRDGMGA